MKKTLEIIFIVIAIILVCVIGVIYLKPKDNEQNFVNNGSGDINLNHEDNEKDILTVVNYAPIDSLDADYDIHRAIEDKCVVNFEGQLYNEEVLDSFVTSVNKKQNFHVRYAEVDANSKLTFIDLKYESGEFIVVSDDTRAYEGGSLLTNTYNEAEYKFEVKDDKLVDGTEITYYELVKGDERITIFGILKESPNTIDINENLVSFDGVIKSIGDSNIVVEPVQGFKEANVSNEIIVSTDEVLNMINDLKVGDTIKVNYAGEINEKNGVYEISK